jgi:hypothetical protein
VTHASASILNAGQVGFYATTATVIPVLVLAYVVQHRQVSANLYRKAKAFDGVIGERSESPGSDLPFGHPVGLAARIRVWTGSVAIAYGAAILAMVLFITPALGEFAALHALLINASSAGSAGFAWIGIAASGGAILLPSLYTSLGFEQGRLEIKLRREAKAVLHDLDAGAIDGPAALSLLDGIDERAGRDLTARLRVRVKPPSA